jgi:glycosyltransferase involved in cell wall biosynthesis
MSVLHVIPAIAARYGGPSEVVLATCRALRALDVDASVLATDADGPWTSLRDGPGERELEGVPCRLERRDWSEAFKYSRGLRRWLDAHVARFDVVHVHAVFSHAPLAAAAACRRARVPYIVRPLGTLDPWSLAQKRWRKRIAWHLGVRRMLHDAAAIHYTTDEERRAAEGTLRLSRGVVIPNGVDLARLDAQALAGHPVTPPPYILALGRLHPKKRLELLIEAMAHTLPAARLVLAGDGEPAHVAALRRRVESSGLEDRVLLPGWLTGPTKAATLAAATALAMPSHQENFGLAAAEAMALGTPVVLTRGVNLAPAVEAAGAGWVSGDDPLALGRALTAALSDGPERARRGESARHLAWSRFGWDVVGRRLVALYEELRARR